MRRVLVVEDDESTSRAVTELLELEGYEARRVRNGADAIDALHSFTPDVVLVDLGLPIMDGRSFIELYRRRVRPAATVIVMSGRSDARSIATAVGADAFVAKPVDRHALLRTISHALAIA